MSVLFGAWPPVRFVLDIERRSSKLSRYRKISNPASAMFSV
jgi:hypothetical protein